MARVWRFGDNVDTDAITPGRFNLTTDLEELGRVAFCETRPDFEPSGGDVIVAGRNFGCGSSRESAALAIKAAGIRAVLAESFARIFFRNAVNVGLQVYTLEDASGFSDGDSINLEEIDVSAPQGFLQEIIDTGGIVNYLRRNGGRLNV